RFLKRPHGHHPGGHHAASGFGRVTEKAFDWMLHVYDRSLQVVLRHRVVTMLAATVVMGLTAVLVVVIPKGFIPDQDTDHLAVTTEGAQGTSYDALLQYQDIVSNVIRKDPNVEALVSTVGGPASATLGGPNLGQIVVHLKPRSQRTDLANTIVER